MGKNIWEDIKRFFSSVPAVFLAVVFTAIISTVGIAFNIHNVPPTGGYGMNTLAPLFPWILTGLIGSVVLMSIQSYLIYKKNTYDPTWAIKLDDRFNEKEMLNFRSEAALSIKENRKHFTDFEHFENWKDTLQPIEDVLDFFDDLGFLLQGGHISAQTMHHYFYYWIRGYWNATHLYIDQWRLQKGELKRWEFVDRLFESTSAIECHEGNSTLREERNWDYSNFLNDEIIKEEEEN